MLTTVKNNVQTIPPAITAKETPMKWARPPAIKLPNGIIPAKVIINTLITLPLNLSSTLVCKRVFTNATAVTLEKPIKIKANIEIK